MSLTSSSPGIADHNIVVAKVNLKPKTSKQIPRKFPLFRKANWTSFKTYIHVTEKRTEILNNLYQKSVEDIWTALKTTIQNGISEFVTIKKIGTEKSLPWLTQEIKRLIRKRDSLYQKQKRRRSRDRHHFKQVKHPVQAKIKMAYNNYLENILGLSEGGDDTAERNSGFT